MLNLAENGARCECGSSALGPQHIAPGAICVCAACGRTWRVRRVTLDPLTWAAATRELVELDGAELAELEWLRASIAPELLRDAPSTHGINWRRALGGLALSFAIALAAARVLS